MLDPAELEDSKLITMVGEVVGTDTVKIDQVTQGVPKLRIKHDGMGPRPSTSLLRIPLTLCVGLWRVLWVPLLLVSRIQ